MAMRPSVFRPTSMMTMSFSMPTTRPWTTWPSPRSRPCSCSSRSAAKSSRVGLRVSVMETLEVDESETRTAGWSRAKGVRKGKSGRHEARRHALEKRDDRKPERPRPSRRSERWIRPAGSDPGPGSRRLDDTAGRIEGGLYTQIGRVQQDGVVRLHHRGVVAAGVAGVAAADILQHVRKGDDLAA